MVAPPHVEIPSLKDNEVLGMLIAFEAIAGAPEKKPKYD
jgi:hypothetical protein